MWDKIKSPFEHGPEPKQLLQARKIVIPDTLEDGQQFVLTDIDKEGCVGWRSAWK